VRARDSSGVDFYRVLGVAPTATRDEITAAYRARARLLHPDTGPSDPASEEQFVQVTAAYRVLTGPRRDEYDRARRRGQVGRPRPAAPGSAGAAGPLAPAASRPWLLTRRGGRIALWAGLGLVLAGLVTAAIVISLQVRDARLRSNGIAVDAVVIRSGGEPRLEFVTARGEVVRADLPDAKSGGRTAGETVEVRYDPDDPTEVVFAAHSVARDITLWIVAAKFLVVGAVLVIVGARRLLRSEP